MIELGEALGPPTHTNTLCCMLQAGPNPKPPMPQNEHCMQMRRPFHIEVNMFMVNAQQSQVYMQETPITLFRVLLEL